LRFREPRFLDRNLSAGIDLFSTRSDFLDVSNFETQTIGGGVSFGFPLTENTGLGLRYRLQSDEINVRDLPIIITDDGNFVQSTVQIAGTNTPDDFSDDEFRSVEQGDVQAGQILVDQCDPRYVQRNTLCRSERTDLASIIGYSFNWDRRNDPIAPTGGFDMSFSQDFAGIGGDVTYLRTEATAATYRGIFKGVRASVRLSGGFIDPLGDDEGVRINNRFFRGGSTFRGFDVAGIGPREVIVSFDNNTGEETLLQSGNSLGGRAYWQTTGELTIPNYLPEEYGIDTALFVEAGSVGFLDEGPDNDPPRISGIGTDTTQVLVVRDDLSLRASAGLSVGWDSPFGPIRFDFSQILAREDYDRTETFRFSTQTSF
ncbi:MAG: BamA/TamA family outer membrane protein, partial [Pseudomonadota bacterium]